MKPLLAHVYEPHRVTYPCYIQPKLNGIRALYQNGAFQSRDELPFPKGLLDHIAEPLKKIIPPHVVLDGELYKHGWPLQRINGAVTPVRQKPTEDTLQVEYHVFDSVQFESSFRDRADYIWKFNGEPGINLVNIDVAENEQGADSLYAKIVELGYEGIMYRLGDCPYTVPKQVGYGPCSVVSALLTTGGSHSKFLSDKDNRCWHLLKRKDWQDDEFWCSGVVEGEGKLQGMLGALRCIPNKLPMFGKISFPTFNVGSGLTDAERKHYWEHPPINQKIKIKYLVLSSDGIPLNPTILCINPK